MVWVYLPLQFKYLGCNLYLFCRKCPVDQENEGPFLLKNQTDLKKNYICRLY